MTQEEKAERYDEILAKAKAEYAKFEGMLPGDVLEDVISELKESDDDKIRKALLNEFTALQSKGYKFAGLEAEELIAWLEKQGEQKPTDNVEPKFHEGDWVVISTIKGDTIVQIASVEYFKDGNPYYITTEGKRFSNETKAHLLPDKIEPNFNIDNKIQYSSIEDAIKAHAKTYSFNIESELFPQLTKEQQKLWRKEIEQACISGGDASIDIFIEKACNLLRENIYNRVYKCGDDLGFPTAEFLKDFKKYIKGE